MRTTIGILIAALIIFSLYCSFFISTPGDVVEKFFNSVDEGDINSAVTCIDPKYEKAYNASTSLLGGVLGFGIKDVADLIPVLVDSKDFKPNGNSKYEVEVGPTKIEGKKMNSFLKTIHDKIGNFGPGKEVGNLLGEKAYVTVTMNSSTGKRVQETVLLKKFDEGWRIVDK